MNQVSHFWWGATFFCPPPVYDLTTAVQIAKQHWDTVNTFFHPANRPTLPITYNLHQFAQLPYNIFRSSKTIGRFAGWKIVLTLGYGCRINSHGVYKKQQS